MKGSEHHPGRDPDVATREGGVVLEEARTPAADDIEDMCLIA